MSMDQKMDRVLHMLEEQGKQQEEIKMHLEHVDSRLEGMETRLDSVETRLDGVETRLDGVETRLDGVETRLDGVETRLDGVEKEVTGIKMHLENVTDYSLQILAENHISLVQKMNQTIESADANKLYAIKVNYLIETVQRLEKLMAAG